MTTSELVKRQSPNGLTGSIAELDPFQVGKVLAASGFFPDSKQEAQAVAKVIAGMEMGFGPMAAMSGIHIIEGKPTLSANLLATCVKRHPKYDYLVTDHTDQGCSIEFTQDGKSIGVSTFTAEDAQRAGIAGKGNFKKYPKAMMFARALSQGVRWYCPDVTAGSPAYVPEELGAEVDGEGEVVTASVPAIKDGDAPASPPDAHAEGEREGSRDSAAALDENRINSMGKGIIALGLTYADINLMLGACGVDGLRAASTKALRERIAAMSVKQADAVEAELERRADS